MTPQLRALAITVLLLSVSGIYAQPGPPPGGGGSTPSCWPPPCVPIDGGISLLIAAGAAYGAKKLYDARASQEKDPLS